MCLAFLVEDGVAQVFALTVYPLCVCVYHALITMHTPPAYTHNTLAAMSDRPMDGGERRCMHTREARRPAPHRSRSRVVGAHSGTSGHI